MKPLTPAEFAVLCMVESGIRTGRVDCGGMSGVESAIEALRVRGLLVVREVEPQANGTNTIAVDMTDDGWLALHIHREYLGVNGR